MSNLINRGLCITCFRSGSHNLAKVTRFTARLSSTSEEYVSDTESEGPDLIEQKRNVSNMSKSNRRKMSHALEIPDIDYINQQTPWYIRRMFALHGSASGVDPSIMWPKRDELKAMKAHEQEFELPLMDRIKLVETQKAEKETARTTRIEEVDRNMEKMDQWIAKFNEREKKKVVEKEKEQRKKDQLLEEAREYFGYEVDPRDAKFQRMIEEKELEAKKTAKINKKQMKVDRILMRVQAMADAAKTSSSDTGSTAVSSDKSTDTIEKASEDR